MGNLGCFGSQVTPRCLFWPWDFCMIPPSTAIRPGPNWGLIGKALSTYERLDRWQRWSFGQFFTELMGKMMWHMYYSDFFHEIMVKPQLEVIWSWNGVTLSPGEIVWFGQWHAGEWLGKRALRRVLTELANVPPESLKASPWWHFCEPWIHVLHPETWWNMMKHVG